MRGRCGGGAGQGRGPLAPRGPELRAALRPAPRRRPPGPAPAPPRPPPAFFPAARGRGPAGSRVRLPGAGGASASSPGQPPGAPSPAPPWPSVRPAACAPRMLASLNEWLWQERLWLPPNRSWELLEDRDGLAFAHPHHMLAALPLALVLVAVRVVFERFVALPLGRWLGVRDRVRKPAKPNATLEKHFLETGRRPKEPQMALLAAQCGLTLRQTQRWFRRRRNQDRPCLSKKFCEASWRFVFYLCTFVGGLSVLYNESWLWTPAMCWENYPNQVLKPTLYWWYLLELSFYISLLITLPFDIKRKDFKEQVAHHFVTIALITFSYSANLLRIGSLVLLLHDSADYLLEACKMFNYTRFTTVCDALFVVFSFVFFVTRLILYPTQVIYTTYFESILDSGPFFAYYFFNTLLMMLQLLHVYWFGLILRMLFNFLKKGQMAKDIRSDVEESDSSDDGLAPEGSQLKNGVTHGPQAAPADGLRSRAAGRLANGHVPAT